MPGAANPNDRSLSRPPAKPLQLINLEDDSNRFFSRLLSKGHGPVGNSSFRVSYGGVAGSVPFVWESQPGTPKHALLVDDFSGLPPLTPPPSSFRSTASSGYGKRPPGNTGRSSFLHRLLRKLGGGGRRCSSSSSLSGFVPVKPMDYRRRRFSSRGSFDSIDLVGDDKEEHIAAPGPGSCFGIGRWNREGRPLGCYGW